MKYYFLFIVLINFNLCVGQNKIVQPEPDRPAIGLVLSGGGAKGFAYIGLLKVLEEVNMPIDYIGGSSIGAIIAGLYSTGYSPETIEEIIREQDWEQVISDKQERKYLSYEEKLFSDKYIFTMPIQGKGFSLSNSLSSSFNIDLLLSKYFSPVSHIHDFNELPIPFLCIGTDLLTGDAVVLDSGNIDRAIRASMAIPGYFSPIHYQGHYMVDGGVVNNYPAEQVKNMGADFILGGDVQSGLKSDIDELSSVTGILDQVISFHRVDANRKGYKITDYYVHIKMPYGMMDFTEYDSIIAYGEKVAREHYSELKILADSINSFEKYTPNPKKTQPVESVRVKDISWPGINFQQQERFKGYFDGVDTGKTSITEIEERMKLLNGSRSFDELRYQFDNIDSSDKSLVIYAKGLNKGSMSAGIHYDNDYHGSILVNFAFRNLGGGSSKLFTDLVLGQSPRLHSMFIINNGFKPGFGIDADLFSFSFPEYDKNEKVNTWQFDHMSFGTFMPLTIKNNFLFKAGFQYELFRFRQDVVLDSLLNTFNQFSDYGNVYISFNLDTRDKVTFTKKGAFVEFKVKHVFPFSDKWSEFVSNATIGYIKYNTNLSLSKKLVFKPGFFAGYTYTKSTPTNLPAGDSIQKISSVQHLFGYGGLNPNNYLEGHMPFTGLRFNESFGMFAGLVSAKLQYNFYPKLYVTLMGDIGFNEMESKNINLDNTMIGYGIKLSYDSFIGPVELSIMGSSLSSSYSSYINIGFWF